MPHGPGASVSASRTLGVVGGAKGSEGPKSKLKWPSGWEQRGTDFVLGPPAALPPNRAVAQGD